MRPVDPQPANRPQPPDTIRRVSVIDSRWDSDDLVTFTGRALDTLTDEHGVARTVATTDLFADCNVERIVTVVRVNGTEHPELTGSHIMKGFRPKLRASEIAEGTLAYMLLDDLPLAGLVAHYGLDRRLQREGTPYSSDDPENYTPQFDYCAGWAATGSLVESLRSGNGIIYNDLPPTPDRDLDAAAGLAHLPVDSMRRRRRLDVHRVGDTLVVDAWFRDSYVDADDVEGSLHEYSVRAVVAADGTLRELEPTPHSLPYTECPSAAAKAQRLVGEPVTTLRTHIPSVLRGVDHCTHLSDTMRGLADVPVIASVL